ncbi:MAG: biotin--[acetyl-CoA-carboxylase] ligase [Verrucomicrobia bacterium]|nr:biotin--[acetyl-CoA-carboxylase] ligase [Verrucomicrobiota bacterium]
MSLDAQLLATFRDAGETPWTATDLADHLGVSRATITRHIDELRQLGFEIEHQAHLGYRVAAWPDLLLADDIQHRLGKAVIGRRVLVYAQTASTNDLVEKLALDGAAEGTVVFAESQTRGRGRQGRAWASPRGKGLWFSVLLRPKLPLNAAARLTIAASVAVARAIREQTGLSPGIKWPNDILIAGRKCGGILAELRSDLDAIQFVVLGIGLDVNCDSGDFPPDVRRVATSLKIEVARAAGSGLNTPPSRADLAVALLRELDRAYRLACGDDFDAVRREWGGLCSTLGKRVRLQAGPHRIEGHAQALDEDGALLVRRDNGRIERVVGGDVVMEK